MAGYIALVIRAEQVLGLPKAAAETRLAQMKLSAVRAFGDTTRTTNYLLKFRVNPPRKLMWWIRGLNEL